MKKIFTLLFGIVFSITVLYSQEAPPQAFSFKATIQGANGQTVVNKMISLRITILQDGFNGFPVYSEFFTPTTNHYSQVDVEIGKGNVLSGIFTSIDWSSHKHFLKVEVDVKGGTNYIELSTTQLLSVPYALYAGTAGNSLSGDYNNLLNKPTNLSQFNNDLNFLSIETDPIFTSHTSSGITSTLISNWNAAYVWGNHTGLYRPIGYVPAWAEITSKPSTLTGYGITDAMSTSHAANGITATNITNWNTAFNWGNHTGLYRPISYVPAWSEIIDKPTFATVATSGNYNDLADKPTIDGSETKVTEGTNVTITGVGTEASPYVINSTGGGGSSSHYIGESYGGGKVFYVYDNGRHGLIAATADQSTGIRWHAGTEKWTMARADGVGAGKANTAIIIANQGVGDGATYAARICNEYSVTVGGVTYGDWYLPSKFELNLLYLQKTVVGGFAYFNYWSSTEGNTNWTVAWLQNFNTGSQFNNGIKGYAYYVRAVRAF